MKITFTPGDAHGVKFKRAGAVWIILGAISPDGLVVVIRADATEPAPTYVAKAPTAQEIDPSTPFNPARLQGLS